MTVVGRHLFKKTALNVCVDAASAACWNWNATDGRCKCLHMLLVFRSVIDSYIRSEAQSTKQ